MLKDQAATLRTLASREATPRKRFRHSRVIVVASGKGGVGKTNIAVNLGLAWAEKGLQVAILDADMGLANADILLGINSPHNLSHVFSGERTVREIMTRGPFDLGLIAGGSGIAELADLSSTELARFIDSLKELDQTLDILLIDTGAGISRSVMSFATASDETIVVATPDPTSIADAYGLIKVLDARNPNTQLRIIVNLCDTHGHGQEVFDRLNGVAQRFLNRELQLAGLIPRDVMVQRAVRQFQPFYLLYPHCRAAAAIGQIADTLLCEESLGADAAQGFGGIGGFFQKILQLVR